jgi:hypothetical protein
MEYTRWMAEKEATGWVPYHIGTTPGGGRCGKSPRVQLVRPGVYRCPSCGKEFPTATAELAALSK